MKKIIYILGIFILTSCINKLLSNPNNNNDDNNTTVNTHIITEKGPYKGKPVSIAEQLSNSPTMLRKHPGALSVILKRAAGNSEEKKSKTLPPQNKFGNNIYLVRLGTFTTYVGKESLEEINS